MKSEQFMGYHDLVLYWIFKNKYKTQQHIHKKSHQDSGDTQGIYKNRVEKEKLFNWTLSLFYIFICEIQQRMVLVF